MCVTIGGLVSQIPGLSQYMPRPTTPAYFTTTTESTMFHIEPDTWLRTMLVFYSLNARLNHLTGDWPQENWMTHLPPYVKERPLTQLSIPGSHDSFAYSLDPDGPLAPDLPHTIKSVATYLTNLLPTMKIVMHNWSKTQQLSFIEQLNAGVRYFDCRAGYYIPTKTIRFLHGLWGSPVEEELKVLPAFLDKHPGEVVILDFNHLYQMAEEDHSELVDILNRTIGDYMIPYSDYLVNGTSVVNLKNLTLAKLAETPKRQVIIVYEYTIGTELSDGIIWPGSRVQSLWPETKDVGEMARFLDRSFTARNNTQVALNTTDPPSYFYVYQGVITPDGDTIISNVLGSIYDTAVPSGTSSLVNWLIAKRNNRSGLLNICIVDGVEAFNFLPTAVAMNIF